MLFFWGCIGKRRHNAGPPVKTRISVVAQDGDYCRHKHGPYDEGVERDANEERKTIPAGVIADDSKEVKVGKQ